MYTLFIDTHDKEIKIILYKDNKIINKTIENSNYQHSEITLPTIKKILDSNKLKPQDLNQIAVVVGPGSFTGVRIGVTIAKTIAYSLKIPIKVLDSLYIKALSYKGKKDFLVSIEDRNGAFVASFNNKYEKLEEYKYLPKKDYEIIKEQSNYVDTEVNYEELINIINNIKETNPHKVNPLYIKQIGVEK